MFNNVSALKHLSCMALHAISVQLGTFSVNCEWACGGLFAVSGEIRTHRAGHVARSQLDRYVLFLIQSLSLNAKSSVVISALL